jgi:hypothetical protein
LQKAEVTEIWVNRDGKHILNALLKIVRMGHSWHCKLTDTHDGVVYGEEKTELGQDMLWREKIHPTV